MQVIIHFSALKSESAPEQVFRGTVETQCSGFITSAVPATKLSCLTDHRHCWALFCFIQPHKCETICESYRPRIPPWHVWKTQMHGWSHLAIRRHADCIRFACLHTQFGALFTANTQDFLSLGFSFRGSHHMLTLLATCLLDTLCYFHRCAA